MILECDGGVGENALRRLFEAALSAAGYAYAPYSKFPVGAALLLADGAIVCGANVENRSFGLTNCAERSAVFSAVSSGKTEFLALAVAAPKSDYPVGPCGACRQVLTEFAPAKMPVIFGQDFGHAIVKTLGELYPFDSLHELSDSDSAVRRE